MDCLIPNCVRNKFESSCFIKTLQLLSNLNSLHFVNQEELILDFDTVATETTKRRLALVNFSMLFGTSFDSLGQFNLFVNGYGIALPISCDNIRDAVSLFVTCLLFLAVSCFFNEFRTSSYYTLKFHKMLQKKPFI